jgi:hypothetical protein
MRGASSNIDIDESQLRVGHVHDHAAEMTAVGSPSSVLSLPPRKAVLQTANRRRIV